MLQVVVLGHIFLRRRSRCCLGGGAGARHVLQACSSMRTHVTGGSVRTHMLEEEEQALLSMRYRCYYVDKHVSSCYLVWGSGAGTCFSSSNMCAVTT